jgi:hypothetical protein
MEFPHVNKTFRTIRWERRRQREQSRPGEEDGSRTSHDPSVVPMICTCKGVHPGRPEGQYVCGAYWTVRLRPA